MPYWFDGNNLIGQSAAAAKAQPRIRRAFLAALVSCRVSRGGKFLVFFDGDDPGDSLSTSGLEVRYSAPLSADETILRRLNEIKRPAEIIVVTNDRQLTSGCRHAGAKTLNWSEFEAKMRASAHRHGRRDEGKDRIKVEEWIRYFGLDEKDV